MRYETKKRCVLGTVVAVSALGLAIANGLLLATPPTAPTPPTPPTPPTTLPTTLPATREMVAEEARGPITYFNANCSSCHGNYGSFWGEGFAAGRGETLREVVDEMASGPGFAPIEGVALDVQTAYNRSLAGGKSAMPFVVAFVDGDRLAGEVTPGSAVTIETTAGEVKAKVDGHSWSANVSVEAVRAIRVEHAGRSTRVDWSTDAKVAWSHRSHQ